MPTHHSPIRTISHTRGFASHTLTAIIAVVATLVVVALLISYFGTTRVAEEVSPFVEKAQDRITEGVVPPSERTEPKNEADHIMDAVAANQGSAVLIYKTAPLSSAPNTPDTFIGRGIMVSANGIVITDSSILESGLASSTALNMDGVRYMVAIPGTEKPYDATLTTTTQDGVAVLTTGANTSFVASFGTTTPQLKELVVAVSGNESARIGTGIVTGVSADTIQTNIAGTMVPGTPLLAQDKRVVGMTMVSTSKSGNPKAAAFKILTLENIRTILQFPQ
jgi:hypothetical protein